MNRLLRAEGLQTKRKGSPSLLVSFPGRKQCMKSRVVVFDAIAVVVDAAFVAVCMRETSFIFSSLYSCCCSAAAANATRARANATIQNCGTVKRIF